MIYAVNMTCTRDAELEELMAKTLEKYCPSCKVLLSLNTDDTDYKNGAGWEASIMKLEAIRQLLSENDIRDRDHVLSVDSDVVFCSPEVFEYANQCNEIIGIKHNPEYKTALGQWSHMSGALIFIRGDIARKICAIPFEELTHIRHEHFKAFDLTENEDVVLSYLASYVGAEQFALPGHLSSGDFEKSVIEWEIELNVRASGFSAGMDFKDYFKSFYHLNYCPTSFMGEPVTGKWDIPRILKMKGIEL
jgi:hypothetical protein